MTNDDVAFWTREEPEVLSRMTELVDWMGAWAAAWLAAVASLWAYAAAQAYQVLWSVDWAGKLTAEPEPRKVRTIAAALGPPTMLGLRSTVLFAAADRPLRVAGHVASWAEIEARAALDRIEATADRWLAEIEHELELLAA